MLFNTIDFVIFFIFVLSIFIIIKNRKFQHLFLLGASYFFFYYSSNYLITLLIFTTIWDYYFGKAIGNTNSNKKRKALLMCSLAGNLGLLGFFKYSDFAIAQFNILGQNLNLGTQIPLLNIVFPIGISFYTFHSITYTVGIYRGHLPPAKSIIEYALFVSFFPQLVAGPIMRAKDFLPQLSEKIESLGIGTKLKQIVIEESNLKNGVTLMAFGFLKKMFFADNISPMINEIFKTPYGLDSFTVILGAIGFGIQIYCDFSGYTDIAIGAATIMGFKLPLNFNKPYFATSPSDFWRRWHISLSSWLRDYLYIPLGGNRKSKLRSYLNLFIVMFLGGLWHGASWNFVIWGILHGAYLALHKILLDKFPFLKNNLVFTSKPGKIFSILITQYLVFLAWIPFRVKNVNDAFYFMQKYLALDLHISNTIQFIMAQRFSVSLIVIFIVLHFISYKKNNLVATISTYKLQKWILFLASIMLLIFFFYDGHPQNFIYFKF